MKNSTIRKINESLRELDGLLGGNCTEEEIAQAELLLNLGFSNSYKEFLSLFGSGVFPGHIVHGLKKTLLMSDTVWSVIDKTLFYKETQKWPGIEDWYIISDDGRGNPIGCKPDGSVWLSDHDAGFEQVKLADDFEQFLEKLLSDTLYDE
tara:strand:+ start:86 stop:535 length:450 start_codon:yes stop_codon:yes gene_type:complete